MRFLLEKIKEAALSVLPIVLIVILLTVTSIVNISTNEIITFLVCTIFLIIGIALFTLGADLAMGPMATAVGSGLAKKKKLGLLVFISFGLGFLITIAEPDLGVLADQVGDVVGGSLILKIFVALGVGLFLAIGILRIVFKKSLSYILVLFYMLVFSVALLCVIRGKEILLPLGFDSGGVTTGPITVPFLMALCVGIANILSGKNANEDSFGIVALCSVGPILVVLLLSLFSNGDLTYVPKESDYQVVNIWHALLSHGKEVFISLGLIVAFFLVCQVVMLKLPKNRLSKIFIGLLYTYIGLVIFLTAVNVGYMPLGFKIGKEICSLNKWYLVPIGFVIGMLVVLAEPAVHVLKKQVEEITGGYITKKSMTIGLSIGVGISIALSMIRICIPSLNLMYIIIPGYFISLALSLFVPRIYTAIAFDSGGVASGPMSSTFILPFAVGACYAVSPDLVLSHAFGIVALIAMTPLITIQLLGFKAIVENKVKESIAMKRILSEDDEQIIDFI